MASDTTGKDRAEFRKKRVKRIKRFIVVICILLLILPTILSVFLMAKVSSLQRQINDIVGNSVMAKEGPDGMSDVAQAKVNDPVSPAAAAASGDAVTSQAVEPETTERPKKVYLTFDDGPGVHTERILDILKDQGIKATFFVTGKEDEYSKRMYRRIIKEGHTLGMHSYSHIYNNIYGSSKAFAEDFGKLYQLLYDTTGVYPKWYRFPGGSSTNTRKTSFGELVRILEEKNVSYIDWNVISPEAMNPKVSKKDMIEGVMADVDKYDLAVVMLYDAADRPMSVKSLPALIKKMKEKKYELLPLEETTTPIRHNQLN